MDAISPEMVRVVDLKVYELMEQVPIQSKINYGMKTCIKYGHINMHHYFDIVNIDRYDVILETVFMRKHRIILDFERDKVRHKEQILPSMKEGPDAYLMVCRQAVTTITSQSLRYSDLRISYASTILFILDIPVTYILHTSFVSSLIITIPHMSYNLILSS